MGVMAAPDEGLYWVCQECQRINPAHQPGCETCEKTRQVEDPPLPLEAARQAADVARVDALLRQARESLLGPSGAIKSRHRLPRPQPAYTPPPPDPVKFISHSAAAGATSPAKPIAPAPTGDMAAGQDSINDGPIPLEPWWPNSLDLLRGPQREDPFRISRTKLPVYGPASLAMEAAMFATPLTPAYLRALLLAVVLVFAAILWLFLPRPRLVQVYEITWSVSVPVEKAVHVAANAPAGSGTVPANLVKWVWVETLVASGDQAEAPHLPDTTRLDERFRTGKADWVFKVTFLDADQTAYPEFFTLTEWQQFRVGQFYRAWIQHGAIQRLTLANFANE